MQLVVSPIFIPVLPSLLQKARRRPSCQAWLGFSCKNKWFPVFFLFLKWIFFEIYLDIDLLMCDGCFGTPCRNGCSASSAMAYEKSRFWKRPVFPLIDIREMFFQGCIVFFFNTNHSKQIPHASSTICTLTIYLAILPLQNMQTSLTGLSS